MTFKFELGDEVVDRISGYRGIITHRSEYLTGCLRYGVHARKLKQDGTAVEGQVMDEGDLILKKSGAVKPTSRSAAPTGGPTTRRIGDPAR